jgi:phosphatidylglycerophosphate synthase
MATFQGSKVDGQLENQLDVLCTYSCDQVLPHLYEMGVTPNDLTTAGLVLGLGAAYAVHAHADPLVPALAYLGSYWFDCADGMMARRYQMSSEFGDYYDHASDAIRHIALAYVVWRHLDLKPVHWVVTVALAVGACAHLGCMEVVNASDGRAHQSSLRPMRRAVELTIAPDADAARQCMANTRWCGVGTLSIWIAYLLYSVPRL